MSVFTLQMGAVFLILATRLVSGCKFGTGTNAVRVDCEEARYLWGVRASRTDEGRTVRYKGLLAWKIGDPVKSVTQAQNAQYAAGSIAEKWLEARTSAMNLRRSRVRKARARAESRGESRSGISVAGN